MNEVELRSKFDKEVSAPNKELLWKWLKEDRYVSEVCSGPSGWEEFKEEADRLAKRQWQISGRVKPSGRAARTIIDVDLDSYEKECAEAASLYLAKKAASLPEVRRFRQERIGGKLLTTEQAEEFLREELQADVPNDRPLSEAEQLGNELMGTMDLEELLEFVQPSSSSAVASFPDVLFPYETRGGMLVTREKIAGNYGDLCLYLVAMFPWKVDEAALFILTGERPEVAPLELTYHRRRRVFTLNFAPWISEKTFRRAYRKCQKVVQGGDNRRVQDRTLAVMRFVTKHTDDEGRRLLSWSQLTDLWNEEHPGEWSFKNRSGLRKAYLRAAEELVPGPGP